MPVAVADVHPVRAGLPQGPRLGRRAMAPSPTGGGALAAGSLRGSPADRPFLSAARRRRACRWRRARPVHARGFHRASSRRAGAAFHHRGSWRALPTAADVGAPTSGPPNVMLAGCEDRCCAISSESFTMRLEMLLRSVSRITSEACGRRRCVARRGEGRSHPGIATGRAADPHMTWPGGGPPPPPRHRPSGSRQAKCVGPA
jgi:hypothetical protein